MRSSDLIKLVALAAIWGAAFIFLKTVSPVLGPLLTACIRLIVGGGALLACFRPQGLRLDWRRYGKHYFWIGTLSSAIPFTLFAYAAMHLPASYLAIINASAPLFGAFFSALWLRERLTLPKAIGLFMGGSGVAIAVQVGTAEVDSLFLTSVILGLVASAAYAASGIYIKAVADQPPPMAIAAASQLAAGLIIVPLLPLGSVSFDLVNMTVILSMAVLAILCSAIAYVLYFQLLDKVGPTSSLTVTFLMPVFGVLWGRIFFGEPISSSLIMGCAAILVGTALTISPGPENLQSTGEPEDPKNESIGSGNCKIEKPR